MKVLYVHTGKPLEFIKFEKHNAPMGWIRADIIKEKLKEREYRAKFSEEELKELKEALI
jgi:hypothetical protein